MNTMNTSDLDASGIISSLEEFKTFVQDLRTARSISCCILTLVLLEIIFTFDKERIYIWRRPWSFFKVFFIHCRYFSIVPALLVIIPPAPSNAYCVFIDWYIGVVNIVLTIWPASCLLAIRLDKLYASKLMRATLIFLVFVESVTQLAVALSILPRFSISYLASPISGTCFGHISTPEWLSKSLVILPYLVLVCVYIAIAWCAFIRHCREKTSLSSMWAVRRNFAPLYILFIRDGVVCYIINLLGISCGFLLLTVSPRTSELNYVGPVVIAGITSVSCCRLALLLHGDPGYATGVYELDTNEIHVEMMKIEDTTRSSVCTSS